MVPPGVETGAADFVLQVAATSVDHTVKTTHSTSGTPLTRATGIYQMHP
jgi:hypothetical protein